MKTIKKIMLILSVPFFINSMEYKPLSKELAEVIAEYLDYYVTGYKSGTLKVWQFKGICNPILKHTLKHVTDQSLVKSDLAAITSISLNDQVIASAAPDKKIKLWDIKNGKLLATIDEDIKITSLAISPDNKYLIVGLQGGHSTAQETAKIYELELDNNKLAHELTKSINHNGKTVNAVAISLDNNFIVTGDDAGVAKITKLETDEEITININEPIEDIQINENNNLIAFKTGAGSVKIWDINQDKIAIETDIQEGNFVEGEEYSANSASIFVGTVTILLTNTESGKLITFFNYRMK